MDELEQMHEALKQKQFEVDAANTKLGEMQSIQHNLMQTQAETQKRINAQYEVNQQLRQQHLTLQQNMNLQD